MNTNATNPTRLPWTAQAYEALPGSHVWVGIAFTAVLLGVYIAGRSLLAGASASSPGDFRLAIVHTLLAGYTASMYAALIATARTSARDLATAVGPTGTAQTIADRVGRHPWWGLLLAAIVANVVSGFITVQTTPGMSNPWDWQLLNYDVRWHRITSVCFNWWIGCSLYVLIADSARLAGLSNRIQSLDLMDLEPYQPLVHQGLTNALLVIGTASVLSLFLLEPGYAEMLVGAWITSVTFAWLGLMLPLSSIRKKFNAAKNAELDWCRQTLKGARDALKSGASGVPSIAEIVAYQRTVQNMRNWPFDNPTLVRFAFYLLIPLGSWFGGAFVERGLDLFLS